MSTFVLPRQFTVDGNGKPRAGAKLNFYVTETVTRKDTFTLPNLVTANANPVVADANGVFGRIELEPGVYTVVLTDSADVVISTDDTITSLTAPSVGLNFKSGLAITNGTDTAHDIDIAAGSIADSADSVRMTLSASLTKAVDVDWVEGAGGGFPSGLTLSNTTWYRVFLIAKPDGTTDAGFDTSATATNLLTDATGYTLYRRIGWVLTDGSANIRNWVLEGNQRYAYLAPVTNFSAAMSLAGSLVTTSAPPLYKGRFVVDTARSVAGGGEAFSVVNPAITDVVPSFTNGGIGQQGDGTVSIYNGYIADIKTNSSSQVRERSTNTDITLYLTAIGWIDDIEGA